MADRTTAVDSHVDKRIHARRTELRMAAWPHGTSATPQRSVTKHTWQQSDVGGTSTDGGEDVVADTLVAADTGAGTVAVGG